VGDDPMPFTFDELLNWGRPLVMVVDHRNKTPERWKFSEMSVLSDAAFRRSIDINRLKKKLEMLEASDDTTEQKIELEMEITRLESETLEERTQRAKANATAKASDGEEKERKKEEAQRRKKEQEEQAPKARGKYKTFGDRMEDLKRFKETHGHANVSIPEDVSLTQFYNNARYARKNPGKGVKLTDERTAAFGALRFIGRRRNTSRDRSTRGSKTPWSTSRRAVTST